MYWVIIFLFPTISSTCSISPPTVNLNGTLLEGSDAVPGQEFFGGIPYAETPIGELRFRLPVPKTWVGVKKFDATEFSLSCLQPPPIPSSEDCLTLNVIRPAGISVGDKLLPVLVWVHGGAFVAEGSSLFNASGIVTQSVSRGTPIIFVSFNYRLGPLGFPPGQEAADTGILNLGLRDLMVAFEWVHDNIEAFGGDPRKVTTFGISAGAALIADLYLNPKIENFVRAFSFQSGFPSLAPIINASHGQRNWDNFVQAIPECRSTFANLTLGCLRTVDSGSLVNAITVATGEADDLIPWVPTLDGPGGIIPDLPSKLLNEGHFAHLPFIAGDVLDEGTAFVPSTTNSTQTITDGLTPYFAQTSVADPVLTATFDRMLQLYPDIPALGSPYNTGNETFGLSSQFKRSASLFGDIFFIAQRRALSQIAVTQGIKSFGYSFTDPPPPNEFPVFWGVPHATDANYFFGTLPSLNASVAAIHLAEQMIDYWLSFTTSLDPNDGKGSKRAHWPEYTSQDQVLIQLNSANTTVIPDNFRKTQITFLNSQADVLHH
ncbi:extracellular triacylglycerol lipase precursor [Mycena pura]|uniref:Extracellular triacylglycerol lipase n=1 Tax=Mycena pura TaxID=153505 RepID=A0AAD6YH02_9AGAR|nr:extracellular triacylglycerol lipase precursor [Mycena pura]